ncbi:oligosaccharide flippase family protein [Coriobacteriia bacterium Es71-Z0120]|uniref:oligosaccharide flippase family protein n=1 Tax=Parvivirga hydrogeniphila TaxID=2939460 RepID=UPI002260A4BA|nr:oligosaccharide flippase family protein [Parvivirga hydrogeniphila]MCL4079346.1 oligosaccharide flippase family protein [Parvivirga hydrogeniphila]
MRAISEAAGWIRVRLREVAASDFARKVAETMATRVALLGIGLVTSVLIARSLGPAGRGLQATVAAITALGVQFGNLGLHSSNTYYVAKDKRLLPVLVGNSMLVGLGVGSIICLAVAAAIAVRPDISPLAPTLLALALAGVPIGLSYLLLQNLLLGVGEVRAYNTIELVMRIVMVLVLAVLIVGKRVSVEGVALVGLAVSAISGWWALARLRRHLNAKVTVALPILRQHLSYGVKAYFSALFAYTVLRADILMCKYILGAEPTGQYSIAASMADLVYMLPVVAGTIMFPRLSATADAADRWMKAKRAAKWMGVLLVGLALLAGLLAAPAVRLLYGDAFLPAVPAFLWLLPGIVALGVNAILMNYFASEGMPAVAVWSPALASLVNIGLNLWLLPQMGIQGAGVASSLAYCSMLMFSLAYLRSRQSRRDNA